MTVGTYVTTAGLQIPTVEELIEDMSATERADIHPNLNTSDVTLIGQVNAIVASHLREAWEVLAIAYDGFNADSCEDTLLVAVSALTGTTPASATKSRFAGTRELTINLNATTTVPIGTRFSVSGDPSTVFVTTEAVTSTTAGNYTVTAECSVTGEVHCNSGTLTVIDTPVVGLNSVTNAYDAILGTEADGNEDLRRRRTSELYAVGKSMKDAVRGALLQYALPDGSHPISVCTVLENMSDDPDPITMNPGHSLECIVWDGLSPAAPDDDIAQVIWDTKGGGINIVGSSSGTATDALGVTWTVAFTRPSITSIVFETELEIDPLTYPGDDAIKTILINEFDNKVRPNSLIRLNDYRKALMNTTGIIDIVEFKIGISGGTPPTEANLQLDLREMGDLQSSDITITTS